MEPLEWFTFDKTVHKFTRYHRRDDYDDERLEGQDKTMGLGLCGVVRAWSALTQTFGSSVTADVKARGGILSRDVGGAKAKRSRPTSVRHLFPHNLALVIDRNSSTQGGRSCAGAQRAPAKKFGLGRKFLARTYAILSRIKNCCNLRTFFEIFGQKKCLFG